MKKKLTAMLVCILLVILVFPAAALAYDYGGSTYNDNDFNKMQAFLNTESDGVMNGFRLNPAYDSDNPTTWGTGTVVMWSSDTSNRRIIQLLLGGSGLAGSLDLSGFTGLTYADLGDNPISAVDVSGDTAMQFLNVRRTGITELDASGLTALNWLTCSECPNLTDVNVSGCTALETLIASGSAADSTDIGKLDTLDVSGCTALEDLSVEKNRLTALDLDGLSSLTDLDIDNNRLAALDVSECAALESLDVGYNDLSALDVSECAALQKLNCEGNVHLASLTIKGASSLNAVTCTGCALTSLDASGLTTLTTLDCGVNDIATLNLTGDTALVNLDCNTNEIENLSVAGLSNLVILNCTQNNIEEIKGLSDADGLMMLACGYNEMQSLDVSGMASLEFLVCDHNQLATLTGSGNTALGALLCSDNLLTSLDFCDSANLSILAERNRLTSIKVVFEGIPVTVTAKGGGYVELYKDMDYHDYYVNAVPCTGESFLGWTNASGAELSTAVKYDLSKGTAYDITANFTALALASSDADGHIYTGGRITLTPNHTGGTWSYDESFLSKDGNTFTALKTGSTHVEYKWEDETVTYDVTITLSELPSTGQDTTWGWLLCGTALTALAAGVCLRRRAASQR